jgi:hypothetical protein
MGRLVLAVAITGIVLNITGWAGNAFLLGQMWNEAGALAPPPMKSPFSPRTHALLQFVSDFVFAFVLCAVYRLSSTGWTRSPMQLAFLCGVVVWLGGVPMCYLGMVNGGYLPAGVSLATTALALATFLLVAPLLPRLLPANSTARGEPQSRMSDSSAS